MNQTSIESKKIARYTKLENTRKLYDFMQALSDRIPESRGNNYKWKYNGYNGDGGLKKRKSLYIAMYNELHNETTQKGILDNCIDKENESIKYLKQNPLSTYLKFYNDFFGIPKDFSQITYCLQYFNTLRCLADEQRVKDDLPYLYEDLCLSIREMTECYAAYILYGKDGEITQLVSRSGYVVFQDGSNHEPPRFTQELWDKLISEIRNADGNGNVKELIDGIYKLKYNEKYHYLIIVLPLNDYDKKDGNIYIVLDCFNSRNNESYINTKNDFEITWDDENAVYKILFMRNRLLYCLKRDYAILLNYRYDCSYIKSVDKESGGPKILHISDLHISEVNQKILIDGIRYLPDFPKSDNHIDLLAITGDIVNASSNASDAQQKYKMAEEFVRELAKHLWGVPNGEDICILPHDWKRRVLIVPGNHDYTTMSDVVVETESRKIKAAFPANESAGAMSKLTYYIEFLAGCLDEPIVELVKYDMNEVRDYKNLKVTVGLFNTVAQSNSLQNNKVGFSKNEMLKDLLIKKRWLKSAGEENHTHIVLLHHSPLYKINYFDDRYKCWSFIKYKLPDGKNNYGTVLKDVWENTYEKLARSTFTSKDFCEIFQNLEVSTYDIHSIVKKMSNSIHNEHNYEIFKWDLRADLEKLDRILQKWMKNEPFSEFDLAFMAQWWSLAKMQKEDQTAFNNVWNNLIAKGISPKCLAGHEHNYHKENEIYVEDQMYNADHSEYNWSVIQISEENKFSSEHHNVYTKDNIKDS